MATSNPILLRILTDDLGMSENAAQGHMARNRLILNSVTDHKRHDAALRRPHLYRWYNPTHPWHLIVTDDIVIAISENWPELAFVDLGGCRITDTALIALATNCAELTKINLTYCSNITDTGVIALADGCVGLTKINLNDCSNITDASVIAIAENCMGLTSIDLVRCKNITDDAVIALADGCVGLTRIAATYIKNITDASIIALANCDYLQYCTHKGTKITGTGRTLIEEIKTRPKPPPLEKGWWLDMDDGTGPRCKGMMN
jgi:hypothetical protein